MKLKLAWALAIILVVAIIGGGAGFVLAETTISPEADSTINAAFSNRNGSLRYVTPANPVNPKTETAIWWNVQGIQGIQGIPGEPGPAGYQVVRYNQTYTMTSFGGGASFLSHYNPGELGDEIISGGAYITVPDKIDIVSSYPYYPTDPEESDGWTVQLFNRTSDPQEFNITLYAIYLRPAQ